MIRSIANCFTCGFCYPSIEAEEPLHSEKGDASRSPTPVNEEKDSSGDEGSASLNQFGHSPSGRSASGYISD